MSPSKLTRTLLAGLLGLALVPAWAGSDHPSVKRGFNLPPAADLTYSIRARKAGIALNGDAHLSWRAADRSYSVASETRAALLGKILEQRSEGAVDAFGLAPLQFYEKRMRREPTTVQFDRESRQISFSVGDQTYPIKGGEQDRASAQWQLVAVARANADKFTPGSEWAFFVTGRRDAEPWVFRVVGQESVPIRSGDVNAVHLVKLPGPDAKGQQIDIWLAPSMEWYPVRLRYADEDGEFIEQTLETLIKR